MKTAQQYCGKRLEAVNKWIDDAVAVSESYFTSIFSHFPTCISTLFTSKYPHSPRAQPQIQTVSDEYLIQIPYTLDKIGRPKTDISHPSNFNIRDGVKQLQDKYITIWREILENSEKLSFYREIKSNYEPKTILYQLKTISFRKELTKLRISNHNLLIERGRYCSPKLPRKNLYVHTAQYVDQKMKNIFYLIVRSTTRKEIR